MSDYYLLSVIILSMSKIMSIYYCFYNKDNKEDYFPLTLDKNIKNKILWYISQITYTSNILLFMYYILRYFTMYNYDTLFKIVSPVCLAVNTNYFLILYPEKEIYLYELSYHSMVSHLMTTFLIIIENKYIKWNTYYEIFYYNYLILILILITIINYKYRNIWTYNKLNLLSKTGYKLLFKFGLCANIFSTLLWSYRNKNEINNDY